VLVARLRCPQSYEKSGGGQLETDKSDVATFEKTYKAQKSASMKNIKKFEKEFNKANKKKKKVGLRANHLTCHCVFVRVLTTCRVALRVLL
jgi:hypothetical protein